MIALVLSVVAMSLVRHGSTAHAQPGGGKKFDTGVVTLGPDQELRITVNSLGGNDAGSFRSRRMTYTETGTTGGVRILMLASQTTMGPITLSPGEAASMGFRTTVAGETVHYMVSTNNPNIQVTAMIIDGSTGEIVTFVGTTTEGNDI